VKLDSIQKNSVQRFLNLKKCDKLELKGPNFERTHLKPYPENLHINFKMSEWEWNVISKRKSRTTLVISVENVKNISFVRNFVENLREHIIP